MMGSKDSHDTEVLNCQQQRDNDAIISSWKEEPGERHSVAVCGHVLVERQGAEAT